MEGIKQCRKEISFTNASRRDRAWVHKAARLASLSSGRSRHGAIVLRGNRVLAVAVNKSRTHDVWLTNRPRNTCSLHAEVGALRMIDDTVGVTVVVSRVDGAGKIKNSKPCEDCADYMLRAGVRRVVYSDGIG